MALHAHELFKTVEDISDLVVPELLLPAEFAHIYAPKAAQHSPATTTPVEVGFCFYNLNVPGFESERQLLELFRDDRDLANRFWKDGRGNHCGRVILKAMLDPDRQAPIDLLEAYRRESKFRGYSESEEDFFAGFVQNWGVLEREQ